MESKTRGKEKRTPIQQRYKKQAEKIEEGGFALVESIVEDINTVTTNLSSRDRATHRSSQISLHASITREGKEGREEDVTRGRNGVMAVRPFISLGLTSSERRGKRKSKSDRAKKRTRERTRVERARVNERLIICTRTHIYIYTHGGDEGK